MLGNWADHLSASTGRTLLLAATVSVLLVVGRKVYTQQRDLGTLAFLGRGLKLAAITATVALVVQATQLSRPYATPPTGQLAVVLGNTQNTPAPRLAGEITELVEQTMLLHRGESAEEVMASFAFVSATANPAVVPLDAAREGFVDISMNTSRANRDVRKNADVLEDHLSKVAPTDNGANYLEAILVASQNVDPETNILVIGSGLSDAGDLDFAHGNLLTSEAARARATGLLREKYGASYLSGVSVSFAGLGDTVEPQYPLSSKQKDIVRAVYTEAIEALGGQARIDSRSQIGKSVSTEFVVDATDTECGPLDRTFTEDAIRFVDDLATYIDPVRVGEALQGVADLYKRGPDRITSIRVAGYIANFTQAPKINPGGLKLSRDRASAVRDSLVKLGIPASKVVAEGMGFGPHSDPTRPELDRMVKVTIARNNPDC